MGAPKDNETFTYTTDDLNRVFADFPGARGCPICACTEWDGIFDEGTCQVLPWGKPSGDMGMNGIAVITLACQRCGYVRQHTHLRIKQLVEKSRE